MWQTNTRTHTHNVSTLRISSSTGISVFVRFRFFSPFILDLVTLATDRDLPYSKLPFFSTDVNIRYNTLTSLPSKGQRARVFLLSYCGEGRGGGGIGCPEKTHLSDLDDHKPFQLSMWRTEPVVIRVRG